MIRVAISFMFLATLFGCVDTDASRQALIVKDLGIQSRYVVQVRVPQYCGTGQLLSPYAGCAAHLNDGSYIIEINPLIESDFVDHVVAHELAHIRQFELGMCISYSANNYFDNPQEKYAEQYVECIDTKGFGSGCGEEHVKAIKPYLSCPL